MFLGRGSRASAAYRRCYLAALLRSSRKYEHDGTEHNDHRWDEGVNLSPPRIVQCHECLTSRYRHLPTSVRRCRWNRFTSCLKDDMLSINLLRTTRPKTVLMGRNEAHVTTQIDKFRIKRYFRKRCSSMAWIASPVIQICSLFVEFYLTYLYK